MKKSLLICAMTALAFSSGASAAKESIAQKGEARLAKMLEGRVAGEPRSCIPVMLSDRLQVIDQTAVVYDAGKTIYVARPQNPKSLDSDDILVIKRFGSELCKQDVIHTIDRTMGFMTGVIFLDDFVPYTKQ